MQIQQLRYFVAVAEVRHFTRAASALGPGRPGIAAFPIASPGLQRTIALARRKDVRSTRAAWAFREALLTHVRGEAASASLPPGVRSLLT